MEVDASFEIALMNAQFALREGKLCNVIFVSSAITQNAWNLAKFHKTNGRAHVV